MGIGVLVCQVATATLPTGSNLMSKSSLKAVWLGLMLIALVGTSPNWLNPKTQRMSGYDAPWVYPALNPAQNAR